MEENLYCTDCVHKDVCGLEGLLDEGMIFCADKMLSRPTGEWTETGKMMMICLENARKQYAEMGYPHRTYITMTCNICRKTTIVDGSITYEYCPHCGAEMQ